MGESLWVVVGNVKGGGCVCLGENEKGMEKGEGKYMGLYSELGEYWGEEGGSWGGVYVGGFVMLVLIVGLFMVKGGMKWGLGGGRVLWILVWWGDKFMGVRDLFIEYVGM